MTFAWVEVETAWVLTVKEAELAPAGIVIVDGGTTLETLEMRVIAIPPAAAGPLRVTVPMLELPPRTAGGSRATLTNPAG